MFENVSVREFVGGFTTAELNALYRNGLKWQNPILAVVAQTELLRRGRKDDVKSILMNFLKRNRLKTDSVFTKTLSASMTNMQDVFFRSFRECVMNGTPVSSSTLQKKIDAIIAEERRLCKEEYERSLEEEEEESKKANEVYPILINSGAKDRPSLMASQNMKIALYS